MSNSQSRTAGSGTSEPFDWRLWKPTVRAIVKRPDLWSTALRQGLKLAPKRWWAQRPWLPLPAPDYLRFRMLTAYGNAEQGPDPRDVITWLEWARSWKSVTHGGASKPAGANPTHPPTASH